MPSQKNIDSLAKASKGLMLESPYYGLFLIQLNKKWDDRCPTSGVGKNGINVMLYINELFWESLTDKWAMGILQHDVLHVVFNHIELTANMQHKTIAAIASNITVNQYVKPEWLPLHNVKYSDFRDLNEELIQLLKDDLRLKRKTREEVVAELRKIPPRGVYIEDFPELKLEPKKGVQYYYDKLLQAQQQGQQKSGDGSTGSQALDDILQDRADGLPDLNEHDWEELQNLSEAELKMMKSQIEYQMKEVAEQVKKSRGTIPGEIEEILKNLDLKEPPKFDWKGYMRRFIGRSSKVYTKRSYRKFNKRFEDVAGLKIKQRKHILYAVDTSGSMTVKYDLTESFQELHHIHNLGVEITVVQFDAGISHVDKYKRGYEDTIAIHGRGGTDFDPIMMYANEHSNKFSALVILTDGCAPAPETKCKLKTLWVHTTKSTINNSLPGLRIQLN